MKRRDCSRWCALAVLGLLSAVVLGKSTRVEAKELPLINENGEWVRKPPVVGVDVQDNHVSKVLYLNRCADGCSLQPGQNDARFNTSSIVRGNSAFVSPWRHGDASWQELVDCVKELYAPYDIEVTDVDPGSNLFHHEAIVAGTYDEIGYETPVGGVAPSQCFPANNVISFTFANGYSNNPIAICHTVGQETAHSYGLEHAFDCSDPMTYLPTCGRQFFRDRTTPCGEYEALPQCQCGGSAQNSHRWLETVLGKSSEALEGPVVQFQTPQEGDSVDGGFLVSVTATHLRGIGKVELFLNDSSYGTLEGHPYTSAANPYRFNAPTALADGIIDVEIVAHNDIGTETIARVTVQKGEACTSSSDCFEGQDCAEGRCFFPPPSKELGDSCTAAEECVSGLCPTQGDVGYCSESCFPTGNEDTCPSGFHCEGITAVQGVCWPDEDGGACGCRNSRGGAQGGGLLLLVLVFLGLRRSNPLKS